MEELVYIIDLLNNFLSNNHGIDVNYSIAPMVAMGALKLGASFIGAGQRKREQKEAQRDFNLAQAAFRNQDTSNVYANLQNTMEDLTVNTQAADMAFQQQQQGIANTMSALGGAAGGSGIAALAQAMAGQQAQNLQQASADIAQQEQANQMAAAQQAAQIQSQQAYGEIMSRRAKADIIGQEFGMAMERKTAADQAIEEARKQQIGAGMSMLAPGGDLGGGVLGGLGKYAGSKGILGAVGKLFQ